MGGGKGTGGGEEEEEEEGADRRGSWEWVLGASTTPEDNEPTTATTAERSLAGGVGAVVSYLRRFRRPPTAELSDKQG